MNDRSLKHGSPVVQQAHSAHSPVLKVEIRRHRTLVFSKVLNDALTIGRHRENHFASPDLPMERLALLARPHDDDPWILRFTKEMDGFLCVGDDTLPVSAIPKQKEAQVLQDGVWIMPLNNVASFSIRLGHYRILGHPPLQASPFASRRVTA